MTRILAANYFSWHNDNTLETDVMVAGQTRKFDINQFEVGTANKADGSVMPVPGHVVGMIVHTRLNDQAVGGISRYEIRKKTALSSYNTETVIMTVDIPGGETGCFYSDPDIPADDREYEQYDTLRLYVQALNFTGGTQDVTVMIGLETEQGSKSGPYTPLDNFP